MSTPGSALIDLLARALHGAYRGPSVLRRWPGTARITRRVRNAVRQHALPPLARAHRRRLRDTVFIGIAGSAGKTTTKRLCEAVLRTKFRVSAREDAANFERSIPGCVLRTRPADDFCLVELSAGTGPGALVRPLGLLQPQIGIVTSIGTDHYSAFGCIDEIAREKGRLVRELPPGGIAVLNADDPRVIAMREGCRARVISFGVSAAADVQARSVEARWPERLSFELVHGEDRVLVRTRLCGSQWVSAALAAAAAGLAAGLSLENIARALAAVQPYEGRMSPVELPDGVTFIRDDWKASALTIGPAFEFLRNARAPRRLLVVGTISDYWGDAGKRYVEAAQYALDVADYVVFVGPRAASALRAKPPEEPERLRAFGTVKSAVEFLSDFLRPGDLVLLKGSNPADHLCRIAIARGSGVTCWREKCGRLRFCGNCERVNAPTKKRGRVEDERAGSDVAALAAAMAGYRGTVVVGLGNPGSRYRDTPHNAGQAVLTKIAADAGVTWPEAPGVSAVLLDWRGLRLCLVRSGTVVNRSGAVLHTLFGLAGILPGQVILVFDDFDLPLGKVRMRMRGSDGGHRGVRSILEAFQTDEFRRIKIGVRRQREPGQAREAVLRPFDEAERLQMEAAFTEACETLFRMTAVPAARSPADATA